MSRGSNANEILHDLGTFTLPPPKGSSSDPEAKVAEEQVFKLDVSELHHVSRRFVELLQPEGADEGEYVYFQFNPNHKLDGHPLCWFGRKPDEADKEHCESPSAAIDAGKSRYGWIEFSASWQNVVRAYLNQTQSNEVGLFAMRTTNYQLEWAHTVLVAPIDKAPTSVGEPIAIASYNSDRSNVVVTPASVPLDGVLVVESSELYWHVRRLENAYKQPWEYLEFAFLGYEDIGHYFKIPQTYMTLLPIEHVKPFVPRDDDLDPKDLMQAKEAIIFKLLRHIFPPCPPARERPEDYRHTSNILRCSTNFITTFAELFRESEDKIWKCLRYELGTEFRATDSWDLNVKDTYAQADLDRAGYIGLLLSVLLNHLRP